MPETSLSVLMLVYNGERFLQAALESALRQTYREFELLVMLDGASTDGSREILRTYAARDPRLIVVERPHESVSAARNAAIAHSKGQLLAIMDCDDVWQPNHLEEQVVFLREHPEISVVCSYADLIDINGRPIGSARYRVSVSDGIANLDPSRFLEIVHSSVLARRTAILTVGGYREQRFEDRDLWGRLATSGHRIACQAKSLVQYRIHGTSQTAMEGLRTHIVAELIDLNVVRRLRGQPEIPYGAIDQWHHQRPSWQQLRSVIRAASSMAYKDATRHFSEGRGIRCVVSLATAFILQPARTISRVSSKLATRTI